MSGRSDEERETSVRAQAGIEPPFEDTDARLRRRLVMAGVILAVAAATHLVDHVIRGEIVGDHNLNPDWNHSGWPFTDDITPFTPSLAIPLVFLAAAALTLRGRLWARFWLVWTSIAAAVVVFVHFLPTGKTETLGVIYRTYDRGVGSPGAGLLAALVVVVIVAGLVGLVRLAIRTRRLSGRW